MRYGVSPHRSQSFYNRRLFPCPLFGVLSITCESRDLFLRYFREKLSETLTARGHTLLREHTLPEDFLIHHITGSFVLMVEWWMQRGCVQSPEEMTQMYAALIKPIFHEINNACI